MSNSEKNTQKSLTPLEASKQYSLLVQEHRGRKTEFERAQERWDGFVGNDKGSLGSAMLAYSALQRTEALDQATREAARRYVDGNEELLYKAAKAEAELDGHVIKDGETIHIASNIKIVDQK